MSVKIERHALAPAALSLANTHPILSSIYQARGIQSYEELQYELKGLLPFHRLYDIDNAAMIIADAIEQQERILIVGDFDADGATSTALAIRALRQFGAHEACYLVPNRFEYGYGLTPEIVEVALHMQPQLLITVDNGISSLAGVKAAKDAGIKVVVTDHHLAADELPNADAIVNPNQPACEFESKAACGCAVIFYVMTAVRIELRNRGWFVNRTEPNMAQFLDLLALASVADVVPLDKNNRILIDQGLKRIRAGKGIAGINALLKIAGKSAHNLVASDLGFAIGPRLNAAGRLDDMATGIECLLTDNDALAFQYAEELNSLNEERKNIERGMQQQAMTWLQSQRLAQFDHEAEHKHLPWGLCLHDPDWHQGVIGILASRIKDKVHRPVIAFANAELAAGLNTQEQLEQQEIKGSARSIPGLHIRDALDLIAKRRPEILTKFGGHAMAAGLSIKLKHYAEFQREFDQVCHELMTEDQLDQIILSDGELKPDDFNLNLAGMIKYAGPWGQQFPEPIFDGQFMIINQKIVGSNHLKLTLGIPGTQHCIDGIAFNIDLDEWTDESCQKITCAYQLDINEFRGMQSVQLMIRHIIKNDE
ncbi:MAG: single-stranded-DNA-specific exonuclease RecJ [Oleispira antarctica]|mgnify:CR=1 FL=1|nr:single-stranded-DNA-specific exonuclease RecJ [Oleispira antarctica]MBQ0791940.1 single-stranded-DNA-specific exonuclease RecJ [Oleispira antarctica]|tara:strand:+ start:1483 stop:3267 length:1785 start_codon:yes stop_codon:yes gene_type:complete